MRRLRMLGVALSSALVGVALVIVLAGSFSSPRVAAGGGTISVGAATVAVGGEGTISLQSLSMAAPGLGAWSMNVAYDTAVVQQTGCDGDDIESKVHQDVGNLKGMNQIRLP